MRVTQLRVGFIGDPILDRFPRYPPAARSPAPLQPPAPPSVLLLPGSRASELSRHLPVMLRAWEILRDAFPDLHGLMVLPNDTLAQQAKAAGLLTRLELRIGGLPEALRLADLAIASTGTVTLECALFGVPTVALYKTSWLTYQIGKRIVKV